MILCIGPTPAVQRVMVFPKLIIDEVNRAVRTLDGAAGKSVNVVKVLKSLGEQPLATGFLGGDRGADLRALLQARGIEIDFVEVNARTRQCITVIDESGATQTELVEESQPVAAADYEALLRIVQNRIPSCRAVVMSGTLTPGAPADFYLRCTRRANGSGALSIVDAQGPALMEALKAVPGLVKPNRAELAATLGRAELRDETAVLSAMRDLHDRGAQRVVITAGREPALAFDGRNSWRIRSPRVTPINPIGSGDAFTAALVWRLLRGEDLDEACRWAGAAGTANALTIMAGEVTLNDVQQLLQEVVVDPI